MLNERRQTQKATGCMILLIRHSGKGKTRETGKSKTRETGNGSAVAGGWSEGLGEILGVWKYSGLYCDCMCLLKLIELCTRKGEFHCV